MLPREVSRIDDIVMYMFRDLFDEGSSPSEVKETVINTLSPFYQNKDALNKWATFGSNLSAFGFVIRYKSDSLFEKALLEILQFYRMAFEKSKIQMLKIIASALEEDEKRENLMFSVRLKTPRIVPKDLHEALFQYMEHIGANLEVGTKHLVAEIYALMQLLYERPIDLDKINAMDFGVLINNILVKEHFSDLLKTSPNGLKLSDWRNIAYHHNYSVQGELVTCTYGRENKSFTITWEEFEQYVHQIMRTTNALNIARAIFSFDNMDELIQHVEKAPNIIRPQIWLTNLKISLASQGFEIESLEYDKKCVNITLRDLKNKGDFSADFQLERRMHSSQFLYHFWTIYAGDVVSIVYTDAGGVAKYRSSIKGEICERIQNGTEDISFLASKVEFKTL